MYQPPVQSPPPEQVRICCSERSTVAPLRTRLLTSQAAQDAKSQQLPQVAWLRMGVTLPCLRMSQAGCEAEQERTTGGILYRIRAASSIFMKLIARAFTWVASWATFAGTFRPVSWARLLSMASVYPTWKVSFSDWLRDLSVARFCLM